MDFPEIIRWIFAGLTLLALAGLVREFRRLRRTEPAGRPARRWDVADQCAGLVTAVGGALGSAYLFGAGLALTAVVLGAGAARAARAPRRRRTAERAAA
ncbi:hypothetical protein ADK90_33400 [Streptomyces sp. XY413]|uniref:hypothetical protein n=1 Tax=Streptomyces sp. XY413 TaxID=1519479 RepID=UPI0006AFE2A6|nr:hypothetical protein [Streptomyces sp. XY413]KOV14782.1 hypothetical protein ADK90_33400 [Streptomyces sp. XY413]